MTDFIHFFTAKHDTPLTEGEVIARGGLMRTASLQPTLGKWIHLFVVVALLSTQLLGPVAGPTQALGPLTIGGLLALSKFTLDKIDSIAQNALANAGEEVRRAIEEMRGNLEGLIDTLEQTYQDNLSLTIDSLDNFTRNKLLETQVLIEQVNEALQEDIELISQETRSIIVTASLEINRTTADLEQRLTDLIVVTSEGIVYIVDRTLFNVILVISLVLLGIGVLIFVVMLFRRRIPEGIAGPVVMVLMVGFIVVFGLLAFVPSVRAAAMDATGLGIEKRLEQAAEQLPEIVGVVPRDILIGETATVSAVGVGLRPEDKTVTAVIGGQEVPVSAVTDKEVAVNVSGLTVTDGVHELVLFFDGDAGPVGVVQVARPVTPVPPADLTITSFSLLPSSPVQRGNTTAFITVRNGGAGPAGNFQLEWKPFATHPGIRTTSTGLDAGASRTFSFNHAYINTGRVDSVATADILNQVAESNEGNNSRTLNNINIQPAPPREADVTLRFTNIVIHDDADPLANGELVLDFNINGQTRRFPASGSRSMTDGQTITLNQTFTMRLREGQNLSVFVNGTERDSPGFPAFDDHDAMGTVTRNFASSINWGEGSHSIRSNCPDGCYTINFSISVNFRN